MPPKQAAPGQPANNKNASARLKVVVRRLPPDLPESVFWSSVSPWITREMVAQGEGTPTAEIVQWTDYCPGKWIKSNKDKNDIHSRAYITFKSAEALVTFHKAYNGWNFKDKTGRSSQAVVEFAPFQKTPNLAVKADPRQATIEQDPDYIAFVESLSAPAVPETVSETVDNAILNKSTPLLDALRAQKAASKAARGNKTSATPAGGSTKSRSGKKASKAQLAAALKAQQSAAEPGEAAVIAAPSKKGKEKSSKKVKIRSKVAKGEKINSETNAPPNLSNSSFPTIANAQKQHEKQQQPSQRAALPPPKSNPAPPSIASSAPQPKPAPQIQLLQRNKPIAPNSPRNMPNSATAATSQSNHPPNQTGDGNAAVRGSAQKSRGANFSARERGRGASAGGGAQNGHTPESSRGGAAAARGRGRGQRGRGGSAATATPE